MKIGVIGYGEVGHTFSKVLKEKGSDIRVYDILLNSAIHAEQIRKKIIDAGGIPSSLEELCRESSYVLSMVVTQAALKVAETCSPFLTKEKIYIGLEPEYMPKLIGDFADGVCGRSRGHASLDTMIFG